MLLADFKIAFNVTEIKLNKMPDTAKITHAGYAVSPKHGKLDIIASTKGVDFSKDIFVYETPVDIADEDGVVTGKRNIYVLSNKGKKDADLTL